MPITNEETIRVAHQILNEFEKWVNDRLIDYRAPPYLSEASQYRYEGRIDALKYAKSNLATIIKKITDV